MLKKKHKDTQSVNDTGSPSLPSQLMIGYYANIKKKDLETFLYSRAEGTMAIKSAYFNIIKFEDGFIWELHEGGEGKGVLKSVIELLNTHNEVIVPTDSRFVKITRRSGQGGVVSYMLNSGDDAQATPGIEFKDSLKPVQKQGHGLFVFGLCMGTLGVASLFGAALFKHVILNQDKSVDFAKQTAKPPLMQINDVKQILNQPRTYVETVMFKKGEWTINTTQEPEPEPEKEMPEDTMNPSAPDASADATLNDLTMLPAPAESATTAKKGAVQ